MSAQISHHSLFERAAAVVVLAVTLGLTLAAVMQTEPLQSANDRSRWCTVWSLVERGSYKIDEIVAVPGWDSIDKVRHEGHIYSSKPPFLSTLVAGIVVVVQAVTGWTLNSDLVAMTRAVLILFNVLPMMFALVIWMYLLRGYSSSAFTRVFLLATAALGTLVAPFLLTLSNHAPAAIGMFLSVYALLRIRSAAEHQRHVHPIWFAVVGFTAAWTCCLELPAAIWGLWTFFWLAKTDFRRTCLWYIPAALIPLGFFFGTNVICTGGIKPFYLSYGTEKYVFETDGIPSYWADPKGLDKNADSFAVYLLHCLIGHHGIFSLTPVFLLMIPGWFATLWKTSTTFPLDDSLRAVIRAGGAITAIVLSFYLTRFDNYNYGGNSVALRWLLWLIPFWLVTLIPVLDRFGDRRGFQLCAGLLLAASTYSAWSAWPNPWQHPWLFTLMDDAGWLDQYHEVPPPFDRPLTTWIRSLPEVADEKSPPWIEMSSVTSRGTVAKRKLIGHGMTAIDGENLYRLEIEDATLPGSSRKHNFYIDAAAFERGAAPDAFLRRPHADGSRMSKPLLAYWQGLPRSREFRPGVVRYLRLPEPINGVRTQRAASQVDLKYRDGTVRRFRCDLWLADALPFGIARIETTVSDPKRGEILLKERWTVTAASETIAQTP